MWFISDRSQTWGDGMSSPIGFSEWYNAKLGHLPPLGQGALWFLYGFVWIPIWYFSTRANAEGGALASAVAVVPAQFDVEPAPSWKRLSEPYRDHRRAN